MIPVPPRPITALHLEPAGTRPVPGAGSRFGEALEGDVAVVSETDVPDGLARIAEGGIDVVVLEVVPRALEHRAAFEQTRAFAPDLPLVLITDEEDPGFSVAAVRAGAQDVLAGPEVDPAVLLRSLRYAIERHRLLTALRSLSLLDDLTGAYNREGFVELGSHVLELARRSNRGGAIVYADIDRFRALNESRGHHVGDQALAELAELLQATFRRSDLVARLGGDDFAVLALEVRSESADALLERLRDNVKSFNRAPNAPFRLSVSIGMHRFEADETAPVPVLLGRARDAMIEEKRRAALR